MVLVAEFGGERTRGREAPGPRSGRVRIAAEFQQVVIQLLSQPNLLLLGTA